MDEPKKLEVLHVEEEEAKKAECIKELNELLA